MESPRAHIAGRQVLRGQPLPRCPARRYISRWLEGAQSACARHPTSGPAALPTFPCKQGKGKEVWPIKAGVSPGYVSNSQGRSTMKHVTPTTKREVTAAELRYINGPKT